MNLTSEKHIEVQQLLVGGMNVQQAAKLAQVEVLEASRVWAQMGFRRVLIKGKEMPVEKTVRTKGRPKKIKEKPQDMPMTAIKDEPKIGKGWDDEEVKIITRRTPFVKIEDSEVLQSERYELFKKDEKNRPVSEDKVRFFARQFKQEKNFMFEFPIVVDKGYTILDGQHRFEALKELSLPIVFRFSRGLSIDNVADVQVNAGWSTKDYLHAFIKQGKQDYVVLSRFINRYKISASVAVALLTGKQAGGLKKAGFYDGTFHVKDETKAHELASIINETGELALGLNRDMTYCLAMVKISDHPEYEHKRMIEQLTKYSSLMRRHMTVENYTRNLEDIYNYKLFTKNKVRFI